MKGKTMVNEKIMKEHGPKINEAELIEHYVRTAGCDHVGTFGGDHEGGIQHQQVPDEIAPCIAAIMESGHEIKNYLEIGVAAGGTTVIMNRFLNPGKIVLIDDNKHPKHHIRHYNFDNNGVPESKRVEIIGHSQSPGAVAMAYEEGPEYDLIFIDGDHTYSGCRGDVDRYLSMLADGGFLVLHDTALPEWGVMAVCSELKKDKRLEFVGEYLSKKHAKPLGVGLFRKAGKGKNEDI